MIRTPIVATSLAVLFASAAQVALAAPSPQDFIKTAIAGDTSEIMLGQLAQQKGGSDKIHSFGKMLVDDHTKARQQAMDVAKGLGIAPSPDPTSEAQDEATKLAKMSGADFDREFAAFMVKDHTKDIADFQAETQADHGPAGELAGKQLPVLKKHLEMAQSLAASDTGMMTSPPPVSGLLDQEGADLWRGSKLMGVAIYGPDDKKVGTIDDVLTDHEGKTAYVVVGVGGFLGMGEKDVAIPFAQVKFAADPMKPQAAAVPATGTTAGNGMAPGATTTGTQAGMAGSANPPPASAADAASTTYPDHGMISMTADQLKAAPTFKYAK